MHSLRKVLTSRDQIVPFGNMFLIGNGHLGFRGTLEEYGKDELVSLNVVGEYDKYMDKWRESINMPNPFKVLVYANDKLITDVNNLNTLFKLNIKNASFSRISSFNEAIIKSTRFIDSFDDIILFKYEISPKSSNIKFNVKVGMDLDIYDINGPHFKTKELNRIKNSLYFKGVTNENKTYFETATYFIDGCSNLNYIDNFYNYEFISSNETFTLYCIAKISKVKSEALCINKSIYNKYKTLNNKTWEKYWDTSRVNLIGKERDQFYIDYSIYHLLILGTSRFDTSIPARGVSGQTYKGAIFWDTEIFLLPFFTLTNKEVARKLLQYRIRTLPGAILKAKEFGYDGAFFAWESQDTGLEACSKYNVTDPVTNKPIRTYFNEKQIHISFDIAYALINYIKINADTSLLFEGGLTLLKEIAKFAMSYANYRDFKYHLDDVIGPDEYHERINDNAYTSYMAYFTGIKTAQILKQYDSDLSFIEKLEDFLNKLYLPKVLDNNLIEQFSGYFNLEKTTVDNLRSRLRHPQDYWGGKNGVATPTQVIKQADVITLLVLEQNMFSLDVIKANFDYYYCLTEHGSSLSSSMYSIAASAIGYSEIAYEMFIKSASIDLGLNQKMYAGGIYIGGTHPASNAGAYLSLVYGMAGLKFNNDSFTLSPNLPKQIKGLSFKLNFRNKIYTIKIDEFNNYTIN